MEQVIVNGVYLGSQYAMIALGLTLIFALMNVLNFAHGQMYVIGGFVTYTFYGQFELPFVLALLMSCVTLAVLGAVIEKFLFGPVIRRSAREESTMLLAAGIAFLLDALILLVFGEKQRGVPKIVDGVFNWDFRIIIPYDRVLICFLAILSIVAFITFMQFTRTGPRAQSHRAGSGRSRIDGCQREPVFHDRVRPRRHAGRPCGRPARHDHRGQSRYGRSHIDQGVHDGDDRRRRE